MARYFAELDPQGVVLRVIVCDDPAWPAANLGGTWVETADPYTDEPQTVAYCSPGFGHDDTWPEKFAPQWRQPTNAEDAYPVDTLVFHNGRIWKNLTAANVWEPGVSGWRDTPAVGYPMWVQPTGALDAYAVGDIVTHNGQNWQSQYPANVWEPGVFGWVTI